MPASLSIIKSKHCAGHTLSNINNPLILLAKSLRGNSIYAANVQFYARKGKVASLLLLEENARYRSYT